MTGRRRGVQCPSLDLEFVKAQVAMGATKRDCCVMLTPLAMLIGSLAVAVHGSALNACGCVLQHDEPYL
jgi:hypothetical protein